MAERGPSGPVAISKPLNCPSCGAALVVRAGGHTLTVVCDNCHSVLDAKDPSFSVLSRFQARYKIVPKIPLGTRGSFGGIVYQAIGMQVRTITVEGTDYSWSEYLLFNPYHGFRYLSEYQGHWNFVRTVPSLPEPARAGTKPAASFENQTYILFQTAMAKTAYVLGEFPWQVKAGDKVAVGDYIAPPRILSSEGTGEEVTWSSGEYTTGDQVWKAFKLKGSPPAAEGVFANQPSPYKEKSGQLWRMWALFAVLIVVMAIFFNFFSRQETVFNQEYAFGAGAGEPSFVTEPFELEGRTSNVQVSLRTSLLNNWAYFHMALINDETGQAFDFGREVSYYRDSDGSEGSPNDEVYVPTVPPGRYYLRLEPEAPAGLRSFSYQLRVRRDVPSYGFYLLALILLAVPPIWTGWRSMTFEGRRWAESDYATTSEGGDDDS